MLEFLSLHSADIIISLFVIIAITAASVKIYKDKKKGGCAGCSGCCGKTDCCGCSKKS